MTFVPLLLLLASGPPYYSRPIDPVVDGDRLRHEIATGQVEAERWSATLRLYLELGELQKAPELVELLAARFPDQPTFQEARMILLSFAGRHDEAIAVGEGILTRHPGYPTIRANLGRVYLEAKQRARGVNLLLTALEQGPLRGEDWKLLLDGLGMNGPRPEQVVSTLRLKMAERPDLASLRYVLVVALTRLGRYSEARDELTRSPSLAENPDLRRFVAHTAAD